MCTWGVSGRVCLGARVHARVTPQGGCACVRPCAPGTPSVLLPPRARLPLGLGLFRRPCSPRGAPETQHPWGRVAQGSEAGDAGSRGKRCEAPAPGPPAPQLPAVVAAGWPHTCARARAHMRAGSCAGTAFVPRGGPRATRAAGSREGGLCRDLSGQRRRRPRGAGGAALRPGPSAGWASRMDSGARLGWGPPGPVRGEAAGSLVAQEAEGLSDPRRTLPGARVTPCPAQQGPSVRSSPQPIAWGPSRPRVTGLGLGQGRWSAWELGARSSGLPAQAARSHPCHAWSPAPSAGCLTPMPGCGRRPLALTAG